MSNESKETPWQDDVIFDAYFNVYKQGKFNEFRWERVSNDNFLISLKEKYVDDARYLESLVLCLKSRVLEAKLRTTLEQQLDGLWNIWYDIEDIGTMHRNDMAPEFEPMISEIEETIMPVVWTEYNNL